MDNNQSAMNVMRLIMMQMYQQHQQNQQNNRMMSQMQMQMHFQMQMQMQMMNRLLTDRNATTLPALPAPGLSAAAGPLTPLSLHAAASPLSIAMPSADISQLVPARSASVATVIMDVPHTQEATNVVASFQEPQMGSEPEKSLMKELTNDDSPNRENLFDTSPDKNSDGPQLNKPEVVDSTEVLENGSVKVESVERKRKADDDAMPQRIVTRSRSLQN